MVILAINRFRDQDQLPDEREASGSNGKDRGWSSFSHEILDRLGPEMGPYGIAVYVKLLRNYNTEEGMSWPSGETIAQATGMSRRSVIRATAKLIELGLVRKCSRKGQTAWEPLGRVTHSHRAGASQSPAPVTQSHQAGDREAHKEELVKKNQLKKNQEGGGTASPALPLASLDDLIFALSNRTGRDPTLPSQRRELLATAKELAAAGYSAEDVNRLKPKRWWRDGRPTLKQIAELIGHAHEPETEQPSPTGKGRRDGTKYSFEP